MSDNDCSPELKKFLGNIKAVVYETNATSKMAIRTVLTDLGIPSRSVFSANKVFELEAIIKQENPQLVFCIDELGGKSLPHLVEQHVAARPYRFDCAFIVLSNYNSAITASEMAEAGVDLIFSKPFTPQQLRESLITSFTNKLAPTPSTLAFEKARELFNRQDYVAATSQLEAIHQQDLNNVQVNYYLAECQRMSGQVDQALANFEKNLVVDSRHFLTLVRCFEIFYEKKAYQSALSMARRLLQNYPINPRRIEQYIRLAVVTHSYADLIRYCEIADDIHSDPTTVRNLAAGLAVGAKFLLTSPIEAQDRKLILLCLQHAARLGVEFPKIAQSVISSYLQIRELNLASDLLHKLNLAGYENDESVRELQMQLHYHQSEFSKALLLSLGLIKQKHYNELVYRMSIKAAIRIGRKGDFIRELYQDGVRRFPGLADLAPLVEEV